MRATLSRLMTASARKDPRFLVLSGDHGYALFDEIRREKPEQFINAGVMEQAMVGMAAGLTKLGFRTLVYGLSSFVPMRVLEQIKLDVCFTNLPVIFLGDGAGLVYSTLGASHQCAEDIACLKPLPNLKIYSPCDLEELKICYAESMAHDGPTYIRVGKADRPQVHTSALSSSKPHFTHEVQGSKACLVSAGSMVSIAHDTAKKLNLSSISVPCIKPLGTQLLEMLTPWDQVIVLEEHSREGGLTSSIADAYFQSDLKHPRIEALTLKDQFSHLCGSYQYALSEHELSDPEVLTRVTRLLG